MWYYPGNMYLWGCIQSAACLTEYQAWNLFSAS